MRPNTQLHQTAARMSRWPLVSRNVIPTARDSFSPLGWSVLFRATGAIAGNEGPRRGAEARRRWSSLLLRSTVAASTLRRRRTHQIRVHLMASGWPIVGDPTYGEPDARLARQALHCWRVTLLHPITRERLQLEAPMPPDMAEVEPRA